MIWIILCYDLSTIHLPLQSVKLVLNFYPSSQKILEG